MLFQLGDGLNAIVFNDDIVKCEFAEKDFTNETRSFGNSKKSDWLFKMVKKEVNINYELILCTDGISEDIIDDTAVEFIHTVSEKTIGKNKNNPILKDILDSWPNKYSSDDKTIVVVKQYMEELSIKTIKDVNGNMYVLDSVLGQGGQGMVCKTKDSTIAIKFVLKNEQILTDEKYYEIYKQTRIA